MFEIIRKSIATGIVTSSYPHSAAEVGAEARGRPEFDFARWRDARAAADACPTGAILFEDREGVRTCTVDLARCTFCGACAETDAAIQMTQHCELAAHRREALQLQARYRLNEDGTHHRLLGASKPDIPPDRAGEDLRRAIQRTLGRSLHIRQVDAGSCNGCEVEITALAGPIYDLERFGIHFVASPRHADMLLVTGPVTRNMELALKKTYEAAPEPRLVVAVGACGCSGGIFGQNYATCGSVDRVLPVDVYIPGCPPNPHALLHGILVAVGRLREKVSSELPKPRAT